MPPRSGRVNGCAVLRLCSGPPGDTSGPVEPGAGGVTPSLVQKLAGAGTARLPDFVRVR